MTVASLQDLGYLVDLNAAEPYELPNLLLAEAGLLTAHEAPVDAASSPRRTKVTLLVYDGGDSCRVVDGQGLYVEIAYDALREL